MGRLRRVRPSTLLAAGYGLLIVLAVWSPAAVVSVIDPVLASVDAAAEAVGLPPGAGFAVAEFVANVAMFVPLGLILALRMSRVHWSWVVIVGFVCTLAIEMIQLQFLSERVSTLGDVAANTVGTLLGMAVAYALRSRRGHTRLR